MNYTHDQKNAIEAMIEFCKAKQSLFTLGGYAGTGKTTTISGAISELRKMKQFENLKIAFVCFTGKASTVLKDKLQKAQAMKDGDYCGTIHSLIYKPKIENDVVVGWHKVPAIFFDIIVIDEASMISDSIFNDLQTYGKPIIAVGDHGQLPPVFSKFNLMENPMIRLEKIHRQAEGNPIIHVSMLARTGEKIPFGLTQNEKMETVWKTEDDYHKILSDHRPELPAWMILCGKNKTRTEINKQIRTILNLNGKILSGEKVICLKNNRRQGIYNGMIGQITKVKESFNEDFLKTHIKFDLMTDMWSGTIFLPQFGQERTLRSWKNWKTKREYSDFDMENLFDFGYCITVHKSQGSQSENVLLIEERMHAMSDENWNRWRYTGITRASKNLIIISR